MKQKRERVRGALVGACGAERMRARLGKVLLYGSGLSAGGTLLYSAHKSGYDPNNIGYIRFGRAALAVGRIGLDYRRSLFSTAYENPDLYDAAKKDCHQRSADKLLKLCSVNGGVFVKVGQHIGALDYLLPDEYVQTMRVLHHNAPSMPLDDIYEVLREELGQEPADLFVTFDEEPLGTASLAQVHKATLQNGDVVAVKVQHKFVKKHSFVDIYTMDFLVRTVKFFFPQFEFMWLADEMKKNVPLELSFVQEAKNAEKVAKIMSCYDWLRVPRIEWSYTTDRVLVMEYCSGAHINDVKSLREQGIDLYDVSRKFGEMYSKMIFDDGYVHCDPHPGNVLVRKNAAGKTEIVLLDHGLYTQLSSQFRYTYAEFWQAIIKRDVEAIRSAATTLGVGELYGLFACMVTARSWNAIQRGMEVSQRNSSEADEIKQNAARYMKEITAVLAYVNRQMILIFKTNDLLRNIESVLGTSNSMASFIQMSRTCLRVLQERKLRECHSWAARLRVKLWGSLEQLKISCYQFYLTLYWSRLWVRLGLR